MGSRNPDTHDRQASARSSRDITRSGNITGNNSFGSTGTRPIMSMSGSIFAGDDRAVQNCTYDELQKRYPMMCFCDPAIDGQKTCRTGGKLGHRGKMPLHRLFLVSWPGVAYYALVLMKVAYMKKFYVDGYPQASLGVMALNYLVGVFVDAFSDPAMGQWTDNCRSKHGRRRPFIAASGGLVPVIFVLSWMPLVSPGVQAAVWFGVFHCLFELGDTLFTIPWHGWMIGMTPLYDEQTRLFRWQHMGNSIGILVGAGIAFMVIPNSYVLLSVVFGLLFAHGCFTLVCFGREPADVTAVVERSASRFNEHDKIPLLMATWLNVPFRWLLITVSVTRLGFDVPLSLLPFLISWVVGEKCVPEYFVYGLMLILNLVADLIFQIAWEWLARRIGKHGSYFWSQVMSSCVSFGFLLMAITFLNVDGCTKAVLGGVLVVFLGIANGGRFLRFSMCSDAVDYDEFLTGGFRREAFYGMALQFVPKLTSIPGDVVPFLLLAYLGYARQTLAETEPGPNPRCQGGTMGDAFCDAYYRNETAGQNICSLTVTCAEYLERGASFICRDSVEACGVHQNSDVIWLLIICISVLPGVVYLGGCVALHYYPRYARTAAQHEKLLHAITRQKRGELVEDPWRPGNFVGPPVERGPNFGLLAYFWPWNLRRMLEQSSRGAALAADPLLLWRPLLTCLVSSLALLPVGIYLLIDGLDGLTTDLGSSVSPLGVMIVGIVLCLLWFEGVRLQAALELRRRADGGSLTREEVIRKYNSVVAFTAEPRWAEAGPGAGAEAEAPDDGQADADADVEVEAEAQA